MKIVLLMLHNILIKCVIYLVKILYHKYINIYEYYVTHLMINFQDESSSTPRKITLFLKMAQLSCLRWMISPSISLKFLS